MPRIRFMTICHIFKTCSWLHIYPNINTKIYCKTCPINQCLLVHVFTISFAFFLTIDKLPSSYTLSRAHSRMTKLPINYRLMKSSQIDMWRCVIRKRIVRILSWLGKQGRCQTTNPNKTSEIYEHHSSDARCFE